MTALGPAAAQQLRTLLRRELVTSGVDGAVEVAELALTVLAAHARNDERQRCVALLRDKADGLASLGEAEAAMGMPGCSPSREARAVVLREAADLIGQCGTAVPAVETENGTSERP